MSLTLLGLKCALSFRNLTFYKKLSITRSVSVINVCDMVSAKTDHVPCFSVLIDGVCCSPDCCFINHIGRLLKWDVYFFQRFMCSYVA